LHSELKRLTLDPGPELEPAKINLSSEVIDVDCEAGILTLKDGSKHQKDLIVAADGVHVNLNPSLEFHNV
jgi:salicylate hydroxylase